MDKNPKIRMTLARSLTIKEKMYLRQIINKTALKIYLVYKTVFLSFSKK